MDKAKVLSLLNNGNNLLETILAYITKEGTKDGKVSVSKLDQHQVLNTDLVWLKSEVFAARELVEYAAKVNGELETKLAEFYAADTLNDICQKVVPHMWRIGLTEEQMHATIWNKEVGNFVTEKLSPTFYEPIAKLIEDKKSGGTYNLTDDQQMIADTFRKFAEDNVIPKAEHVHRHDDLIPSEILNGLKELGCFGLSIPQKFGGFQPDDKDDNISMLLVTEELSRGSVGVAGSLITRPEILSKALLKGGTEEQKQRLLPLIATGERMAAVAVTEPDYGSDVASLKVGAKKTEGGWLINGVKTWCTYAGFADTLLVLCRTDPDLSKGHKGLSILLAEKPSFDGHEFSHKQPSGGTIEGKAIGTIGYRGMHSFEVSFQDYFVPDENLVGGPEGLGKGFYLQMAGFAGGRLQTAARANGVMQAAFEKAIQYSLERSVFGKPIINYQITKYRLVRMAAIIQASRQFTYASARLMDEGRGQMEASLVKYYASKISEWVTREAMQLHGGMGYAEEYAVSRFFVDARVFSIFEGAEDTLVQRVIIRSLVEEKMKQ
ncbi:acyl-CoA/acyl-ACP dehydrogenase [bacterium]|nr:acyl-CoA/acyl-ACP dehydrogenase [bacterium]